MAEGLLSVLPSAEIYLVASVLLLAIIITPFVNNASTAIVLGPIAIGIAQSTGLPPEPFLLAIALGVSIDFLTPFGHHNNTLVMGIAGYSFGDFLRLGAPLVAITGLVTVAAVTLFF